MISTGHLSSELSPWSAPNPISRYVVINPANPIFDIVSDNILKLTSEKLVNAAMISELNSFLDEYPLSLDQYPFTVENIAPIRHAEIANMGVSSDTECFWGKCTKEINLQCMI